MHNNLYDSEAATFYSDRPALQLQTVETKSAPSKTASEMPREDASASAETATTTSSWISAFNTSLLTTRAHSQKEHSSELGELMQTPEFASLLVGAQHLAATQGLSKEEATERLIEVFRRLDFSWKQIILKRGLQAMIE